MSFFSSGLPRLVWLALAFCANFSLFSSGVAAPANPWNRIQLSYEAEAHRAYSETVLRKVVKADSQLNTVMTEAVKQHLINLIPFERGRAASVQTRQAGEALDHLFALLDDLDRRTNAGPSIYAAYSSLLVPQTTEEKAATLRSLRSVKASDQELFRQTQSLLEQINRISALETETFDPREIDRELIHQARSYLISISSSLGRAGFTVFLGGIASNTPEGDLHRLVHLKPVLEALGIWNEFQVDLRITALRALAVIRNPNAYTEIARCARATEDSSIDEQIISAEARRLLLAPGDSLKLFTYSKEWGLVAVALEDRNASEKSSNDSLIGILEKLRKIRESQTYDEGKIRSAVTLFGTLFMQNREQANKATKNAKHFSNVVLNERADENEIDPADVRKIIGAESFAEQVFLRAIEERFGPRYRLSARIRARFQIAPQDNLAWGFSKACLHKLRKTGTSMHAWIGR